MYTNIIKKKFDNRTPKPAKLKKIPLFSEHTSYVYVVMCSISNFVNHYNSWAAWDIELTFGTPPKQSRPSIRDDFHGNWSPIRDFMGF